MLDDVMLMPNLTDHERLMFQSEMEARRKEPTTSVLLAVFLGDFGAHHFYMGRTGLGILYACFCWTLVPGVVALIEAFMMPKRVRMHNYTVGQEISIKLMALRPGAGDAQTALPPATLPTQSKGGALKAAALGAAGGAVAGAAAVRAADVLENAQSAEVDGIAGAAETAGEEGEGVASTLASLLGDE